VARGGWAEEIYPAAELFVERSLRASASFVTGSPGVWTPDVADDFYERFVINEDLTASSFLEKLARQLSGASDATVLLAADLVALCTIPVHDMGSGTKSKRLQAVLSLLDPPPEADPIIRAALTSGIASYGAGNAQVWKFMRYLAEFARAWTRLEEEEREHRLADAWAWKELLAGISGGIGAQAAALLHMVFPDVFEPIVSVDVKAAIGRTFAGVSGVGDEPDTDRKLILIRTALAPVLGETFQFWDSSVQPVWRSKPDDRSWTFAEFARKFGELATFDEEETDYKLELASRLAAARKAVLGGDEEWLDRLKRAFASPNNITSWRQHDAFLKWCESSPDESRRALAALWAAPSSDEADLDAFLAVVPDTAIDSPGGRANVLSYLCGAWDPKDWINYKATGSDRALRLCDLDPAETRDVAERIARFRAFIDELRVRIVAIGGGPTTRLEAQGMTWFIVGDHVPDEWDEGERAALTAFRAKGGEPPPPPPPPPTELRAWHFRGFTLPDGSRSETHWLEGGFVSTFWAEVGPIAQGASTAELQARVREAYPDDPPGRWRTTTGNLYRFATAIRTGDLVVTTLASSLFVGRVVGESKWDGEAHPWLARRRSVEWLNAMSPASRDELSADLLGALKKPLAVSKIHQVGEVAALVGLGDPIPPPPPPALPAVTTEVADRVFFDVEPLQEIVELLGAKKQLVFYGPPGTGKTLVAQVLAEHLTAEGGMWQLAQFHPSYSYEDFMEGYRPNVSDDGLVTYELRQGPLRRIAEEARDDPANPYVLIVDEINRGNIPKIFGELLFLLEYRDEPIALQYSEEPFSLPPNLFLIGTMNTADRSIALVDAALRRRFYFIPFLPSEAPVKDVLRRWLARGGYSDLPALLLDELNQRIAKDEVAIGPSYFMGPDPSSSASLRRVWRHAILPLLDEHYYGTKVEVHSELSFDACLKAVTVADESPSGGADESPADAARLESE
jgi:DNA polymerase III delta prime subunit